MKMSPYLAFLLLGLFGGFVLGGASALALARRYWPTVVR